MARLIAGLGNPGKRYEATKHNVGFMVVDLLAESLGCVWKSKGKGLLAESSGAGKVVLLKPQTFMNLSGESVREICDFYKIAAEDVLVIYDDLDLPPGSMKARKGGSDGGHNGIKSIIQRLGCQDFPRLKIGIGKAPAEWRGADWVLSCFTADDWKLVAPMLERARDAAEYWLKNDITAVMNEFNGRT